MKFILNVFLVLIYYVILSEQNALKDPFKCGMPTCDASTKFLYKEHIIYHYNYKANVDTLFAGSTSNHSTLNIKTEVTIQFFNPCEGIMQIYNVTLKDQDKQNVEERTEMFVEALSKHPLRFAFHEGLITEICPVVEENEWVLNIKRSILSLYQNNMKRFDIDFEGIESDIHGTCQTSYKVRGQHKTSLLVVKTRDLSKCTDRYKYTSILQTIRYNFQSEYQTWPVLKSDSKCVISIDHKIYNSVHCKERHLFIPFSGKLTGAMTTLDQSLVLNKEVNKTDNQVMDENSLSWSEVNFRSSLIHHHTAISKKTTGEHKKANDIVLELCRIEELNEGVSHRVQDKLDGDSVVGAWAALIRSCRQLSYPELYQLLDKSSEKCPHARKFIIDALPYIARASSVEMIKDMLLKGTADQETKQEWLMSLAMIPRPNKEMIISMSQLLIQHKMDKLVSFTVSSMLHTYCKQSYIDLRDCNMEPQNTIILKYFEDSMNKAYQIGMTNLTRTNSEQLMISLKALGNIGGIDKKGSDLLMTIIEDSNMPTPIRLNAIEAFRKTPCPETRDYFLHLFREDFVDVEVRLASYLQVMKCPKLSTIRKIIHALKHEPVRQASSFVWSHLNNLGKSSLPSRVEVQGLLSGGWIPKYTHRDDFRSYSANYERSVFFDEYNAGGSYEANVIFSPDSYIPRSVSLNLTIDMFGESINLLELKGRGEGFERYFEEYFGTNGPLNKETILDKIEHYRPFRSINNAKEARRKVDGLKHETNSLKHRFPLADLGVKVFGNEISYWNAEGDEELRNGLNKLNPLYHVNKILSGKEISYKKASLFLDTTYAVPTGCGLPLNMNLMGTSYINLKVAGSLQGAEHFFTKKSLDFEGKIQPSVSLNVAATMGVYAGGLSSTGIRANIRLYTATALEVKLKIRGTELVDVDLSLPYSEQEIFAAKSEILLLHGEQELRQIGFNTNRIEQSTCSWSTFDRAIGVKICASYEFPNMTNALNAPYYLLSGPSKYIVSLEKVDPSAKKYSIRYRWDANETSNHITFSFDTPNSKDKRMFNASINSVTDSGAAAMTFQSSEHTFQAKITYRNRPDDKLLESYLDIDGRKHFDTVVSLKKHPLKNGYAMIPNFYIVVNSEKIAELTGTMRLAEKKGVSQCDVSLEFQTKRLASRLVGYITWNGPTRGVQLRLDYMFLNERRHSLMIDGVLSNRDIGHRKDLYADLALKFTSYPQWNFYTALKYLGTPSHIETSMNISSSREQRYTNPKLQFGFALHRRISGFKLDTRLKTNKPNFDVILHYEELGSEYIASCVIGYSPHAPDIAISGSLYYPPGAQLYLDGSLNMTLPGLQHFKLHSVIHEAKTNEYEIKAECVWFTGLDLNLDALYQYLSTTNIASHRVKMVVSSSKFKDVSADLRYTQDNRQINVFGKGEFNDVEYGTLLRYVTYSEGNFTAYGHVDIGGKMYSINLLADMANNTDIMIDMHLDQYRDIHLTYQKKLTADLKHLSAVVNWDANRDPSKKVCVEASLRSRDRLSYAGNIMLYYPDTRIDGEFDFLIKDWFCQWLLRLGWSTEAVILWRVKLYSEVQRETIYAMQSHLDTPLKDWRDISFNLMWRYKDNLQAINGSMNLERDFLTFNLLGDYMLKTNEFYGEINAAVNSSIPGLPKAAAIARHAHVWKKTSDTLLSFQYNDDGLLMINSSWKLDQGEPNSNISGRVSIISPFQGYKKGLLKTKLIFGNKRNVQGKTYLDLEDKPYIINVDGYMQRITNCMLILNVTTPIRDVVLLSSRFGFIERDRHMVAMIVTPNTTTGGEILLKLNTAEDFHIYGFIALPVQFLQRALVLAKMNKDEIDLRLGWDRMDFGITGIWHYETILNFQYLYKLYTPVDGFEENGLVLKNIYDNGLDTEFSIRLSKHKFGVSLLMRDSEKGLIAAIKQRMENQGDPDLIIDNFSTNTYITIDTLYFPTITFTALVNKYIGLDELETFHLVATLNLPNRTSIVLTDTLYMENYLTTRNILELTTPYELMRHVKSEWSTDVIMGLMFNVTFVALFKNKTGWSETSAQVFYEYTEGKEMEYTAYLMRISMKTPLPTLHNINSQITLHTEDSVTRLAADLIADSFNITAAGQLEIEESFIESTGGLNLSSPYLDDYQLRAEFKKDFSADIESVLALGLQLRQADHDSYMFTEVIWRPNSTDHIKFRSKVSLQPIIPPSDLTLHYTQVPDESYRLLHLWCNVGNASVDLDMEQKANRITTGLKTPMKGWRNVNLICEIDKENHIRGTVVKDSVEYDVDGVIKSKAPVEISVLLKPKQHPEVTTTVHLQYEYHNKIHGATLNVAGPINMKVHARLQATNNVTDLLIKVESTNTQFKDLYIKSRFDLHSDKRGVFSLQSLTPIKSLRNIKADADISIHTKTGFLKCNYDLTSITGKSDLQWSFFMDNMYLKAVGIQNLGKRKRSIDFNTYIGNKTVDENMKMDFAGFHMNVDNIWQIAANGTLGRSPNEKIFMNVNGLLPKPNIDVHSFTLESILKKEGSSIDAKYTTDFTKKLSGIEGKFMMLSDRFDCDLSLLWGANRNISKIENKLLSSLKDNGSSLAIDYHLKTPIYVGRETFNLNATYKKDFQNRFIILGGKSESPEGRGIGDIDITYGGLRRTYGNFNLTTPFAKLPWLKADMDIMNNFGIGSHSKNRIDIFWSNKTATLNTKNDITKLDEDAHHKGNVVISLPLKRQHIVDVEYNYLESSVSRRGNTTVFFDDEKFVEGCFKTLTKKGANDDITYDTDIEIENAKFPVGIKYLHDFKDNGSIDTKLVNVFHLHDVDKFNITGIMGVKTWETGKNLSLTAIHADRALLFENHYDSMERDLTQGSKLKWSDDVWLSYDVHITNMTTDEKESQRAIFWVHYPRRSFNIDAVYGLQDTLLETDASLFWNVRGEDRTSKISAKWETPYSINSTRHVFDVGLSHPSFRKDVTLRGEYKTNTEVMSNLSIQLQYSDNDNEHLTLRSFLKDNSDGPLRDYQFELTCKHPTTNLDLNVKSKFNIQNRWYFYHNYYSYQKSLFYQKLRENRGLLNLRENFLEYERNTESEYYKLNGTWDLQYPHYTGKVWVNRTNGNDTGEAVISLYDKIVYGHFNKTDDVSYHLIGRINDARSAEFKAWRDFDDIKTYDVSSYVRLNHSRLLTSSVLWRPEIFAQTRAAITYSFKQLYDQVNETLTIVKETPLEIHTALKNVWNDATPRIRDFLDDLNELHVIKPDLDEFNLFLNESYNNNDYYVKDIVEFSYYVLDQMALKNHLDSFPALLTDAWALMGDTSSSIKNSLMWVIDTIKKSYNNFMDTLNKTLESDFMDQVSSVIENGIMQYDGFIKALHYKFITFWDTTWIRAYSRVTSYWNSLLKSMEPTLIRIIHYVEQFAWKVGTETMDFFYQRTHELTESPYFNYLANLGQDLEHFWKDMTTNDAITNIKKYSKIAYEALYANFIVKLPFRKELQEIGEEIWLGLNQLQNLSIVKYVKAKFWEAKARLNWWYDYFRLHEALVKIWEVLYRKAIGMPKTALQYEEEHRTAKTNFIFDPVQGKILLEQKLPMSWHAFNRTPDFTEIPEYKVLKDFVNDWFMSNNSVWTYYYELKPYMNLNNLLPPFSGLAIMTGQGTLITFDKAVYTISEPGTFLLTKDYYQNNFTLLMESNSDGKYNLIVLTRSNIIRIDLYKANVFIGDKVALTLPTVIDEYTIYREIDVLYVTTKHNFGVECNFIFKTCKVNLSGWYFGSVDGLLGTMNHEVYDDMALVNNTYTDSPKLLAESWNIERNSTGAIENYELINNTLCENFFKNKVSPLRSCFDILDASSYYDECMSGVDPCVLASVYLELCSKDGVPLHIPENCVQCTLPQGDVILEGSFYEMSYVPNATDIVFLVEAQLCNYNIRKNKSLDILIEVLEEKLLNNGINDNRYAVIGFGGSGLYKKPKSLYVDNTVFTNANDILSYFDRLQVEKEDMLPDMSEVADMFGALEFATNLPFRPGTSKTFILFPCTRCDIMNMKLDYSVVHQVIIDTSVTLHIMMDEDFSLSKRRVIKTLYGVDSQRAYTIKDTRGLKGDEGLRAQVKLPKTKLGFCTSLAIESNGTLFTGKKLQQDRGVARRLSNVFGERVAQSARPCTSNSGRGPKCECRDTMLYCRPCGARLRRPLTDLSDMWDSEEVDQLIDNIFDINLPKIKA